MPRTQISCEGHHLGSCWVLHYPDTSQPAAPMPGYNKHYIIYTVVPALGNPCDERPPAMYGHVTDVPTHINIKLPQISGHLPNTDSYLLVVHTVSTNTTFSEGHFMPKSLVLSSTLCFQRRNNERVAGRI